MALENQPFFKAPSVPKLGRRVVSSSVFSGVSANKPQLQLNKSKFSFFRPASQPQEGQSITETLSGVFSREDSKDKQIYSALSETNRILVEIQKQLSLDFASRITEKKQSFASTRSSILKKRALEKERALESIDNDTGIIRSAFDKITAPAKSIFDRIIQFLTTIATGFLVNAAFGWLSKKENREKLAAVFKFIVDHWKWIVGVFIGAKLIGAVLKIIGLVRRLKGLVDLIRRAWGKPPSSGGPGKPGGGPNKPGGGTPPGSPDFCKGVYACIAGSVLQYVKLFSKYFSPINIPVAPPVGGSARPPVPVAPIFRPSPTQPITQPPKPTTPQQTPWYNTPLAQTLGYGALGLGLGALAAGAFISPFEGPVGEIGAGSAAATAFGRASGAFRTLSGGGRNIPKRAINPTSTTLKNIPGSPADILRSPTLTNKFLKFLKQNPSFRRSGSDPSRLKSIEDFASFSNTTAENLIKSQFKNFVEYLKSPAGVRLSQGGTVGGKGSGTVDSVPAMLAPGEEVIRTSSANLFRPLLKDINDNAGEMWKSFENAIEIQQQNNARQQQINNQFKESLLKFDTELESLIKQEKNKKIKDANIKLPPPPPGTKGGPVGNIPPEEGTGKGGPSDTRTSKPPTPYSTPKPANTGPASSGSAPATPSIPSTPATTSPPLSAPAPTEGPSTFKIPTIPFQGTEQSSNLRSSSLISSNVDFTRSYKLQPESKQSKVSITPFQLNPIIAPPSNQVVGGSNVSEAPRPPAISSVNSNDPYIRSGLKTYGIFV